VEVLGQLLDMLGGEVAFSIENAVTEADVSAKKTGEITAGQVIFREEKLERFQAGALGEFHRLLFIGFRQLSQGLEVIGLVGCAGWQYREDIHDILCCFKFGIVMNLSGHKQSAELSVGFRQLGRFIGFDFGAHNSVFH